MHNYDMAKPLHPPRTKRRQLFHPRIARQMHKTISAFHLALTAAMEIKKAPDYCRISTNRTSANIHATQKNLQKFMHIKEKKRNFANDEHTFKS